MKRKKYFGKRLAALAMAAVTVALSWQEAVSAGERHTLPEGMTEIAIQAGFGESRSGEKQKSAEMSADTEQENSGNTGLGHGALESGAGETADAGSTGQSGNDGGDAAGNDAGADFTAGNGSGSGGGTSAGNGSGSGGGTSAGKGSGSGGGTSAGNGSGSGGGTSAGTGNGSEVGTSAGSGNGSGAGSDAGSGNGSGTGSDAGNGAGLTDAEETAGEKGNADRDSGDTASDGEQTESGISSDGPEVKQLSARKDDVEITVTLDDGNGFDSELHLELLSVPELFMEEAEEAGTLLASEGIKALANWCIGCRMELWGQEQTTVTEAQRELLEVQLEAAIAGRFLYYIKVTDDAGEELELRDTVTELRIHDRELYQEAAAGNLTYCVMGHEEENGYEAVLDPEKTEPESGISEEDENIELRFRSDTGWLQLLAIDSAQLSEAEAKLGMQPEDEPETELQSEEEPESEQETERNTEPETELWADAETEQESESELMEEEEALSTALLAQEALTPEGTIITAGGSGYTIVNPGDRTYSAKYCSIKAHTNSTVIPWNSAGNSVISGHFTSGGENYGAYLLPQSMGAAGKFGFRVTNVTYNAAAKCNMDLLVTVVNYDNYTYSSSGTKISGIYPYLGMFITSSSNIGFAFFQSFPKMEVKCDLVQSGTNTPVTGNYRVKMLDIDFWQRYGICMQNGAVEQKYALSGSVVYTRNRSAYDRSYLQFAGNGAEGQNSPAQTVMYELGNTSGIYLLFMPSYRNRQTPNSENRINMKYTEAKNGTASNHSILEWDGSAYGAIETASPVKYVSNDGKTLGTSNQLPSSGAEYYYTIDHFVPEESSTYYYSEYSVSDTLPAGVDYAGSWSAVQLESGANVSSWFSASAGSDSKSILFSASAAARAGAGFYGFHYRFTIKVKMNPGQIAPAYSGNTATYTVNNTAQVRVRHLPDANAVTKQTNMVTTSARETRITPDAPYKRMEAEESLIRKVYENTENTVVFSVYQKLPRQGAAWTPTAVTMTEVLEDCLVYESCEAAFRGAADDAFTGMTDWEIQCQGQTVTASRAYDPSLAGGTVRWDIVCTIPEDADLDGWHKVVDGKTWIYIPDTARVKFDWNQGSPRSLEQTTNEAAALFPAPELGLILKKVNKDTGEIIENAGFTVYEWDGSGYSLERGKMEFDQEKKVYVAVNLDRTNANEGKFKVVETITPRGFYGSWEKEIVVPENGREELELTADNPMARGTITVYKKSRKKGELLEGGEYVIKANKDVLSPQGKVLMEAGTVADTLTTGADGSAVSRELYPGEYCVTEVKAPLGYSLDADPVIVTVSYRDKDTAVTNVEADFVNDRLYGVITLTKEIDAADIVWAHGNPVFTFRAEGEDVLGVSHTYCETVEFTQQETAAEGKAVLTVRLRVLAGKYTVTEEKTMRYDLAAVYDVEGGSILPEEDGAAFDLSEGQSVSATFYNVKTTDEDESHSTFVRNRIVEPGGES